MADAISIEETNRLRISLGLKPLPVPGGDRLAFKDAAASPEEEEDVGSTLESRQAEGYDNYRKLQEVEEAKNRREAKAAAVKKARDAAKRFSKLEGKGLGDDDGELDAKSWLLKQKKRQKEIDKARKREQELADAEAAAEYTAKDLAGVKVGHEFDTFEEGEDQVLTLKDTTIDQNEEEGDELENLDLREREKLNEKLELKKKKPVYNPNDTDDGDKSILAHYDEEIDGKKGHRFTLDGQGSTAEALIEGGIEKKLKPKAFSLDLFKDEPKSDYLDISEIKIKKPKKKKAKSTRQKAVDEDDIFPTIEPAPTAENENAMDIDQPPTKKRIYQDTSFVDDDDLQASLAAQRRNALKKRKKLRPEELAQQILEEAATPAAEDDDAPGGLVIDETSEFVANLQKPVAPEPKRRSASRPIEEVTTMGADSDEEGDVNMNQSYADIEDEEDHIARLKREISASEDITETGLDREATLDRGLGSTLKLLKERGIIKTEESGDLNAIYRSKQLFLAEKQRQESVAEKKARTQRERDRATGKLDRMSAREKEDYARSQNNLRDQQESRQLAEHFNKDYKPNVELKYIDEFGRSMNQKEAFKHMSHQFHGKGSGKQKTEKMLKKIEDEKRREAQSSLDGSRMGGMSGATAQQLKKQRQAGVRLA
ncbi:U4/U6.U5 tri-snRNP-associated protein snu66 [Lachnellula suecica]|uniref:U4/U6.U5 tri-snRNP-associated protein snu66 n=1 Tax=Lachnellula suecica TaxID=602035 RepID=A0A8T9C6J5_9HELO|nr:U4/U6.U5 tri-snRNP-associated protein snu66 [Lachnellula suecica]